MTNRGHTWACATCDVAIVFLWRKFPQLKERPVNGKSDRCYTQGSKCQAALPAPIVHLAASDSLCFPGVWCLGLPLQKTPATLVAVAQPMLASLVGLGARSCWPRGYHLEHDKTCYPGAAVGTGHDSVTDVSHLTAGIVPFLLLLFTNARRYKFLPVAPELNRGRRRLDSRETAS